MDYLRFTFIISFMSKILLYQMMEWLKDVNDYVDGILVDQKKTLNEPYEPTFNYPNIDPKIPTQVLVGIGQSRLKVFGSNKEVIENFSTNWSIIEKELKRAFIRYVYPELFK